MEGKGDADEVPRLLRMPSVLLDLVLSFSPLPWIFTDGALVCKRFVEASRRPSAMCPELRIVEENAPIVLSDLPIEQAMYHYLDQLAAFFGDKKSDAVEYKEQQYWTWRVSSGRFLSVLDALVHKNYRPNKVWVACTRFSSECMKAIMCIQMRHLRLEGCLDFDPFVSISAINNRIHTLDVTNARSATNMALVSLLDHMPSLKDISLPAHRMFRVEQDGLVPTLKRLTRIRVRLRTAIASKEIADEVISALKRIQPLVDESRLEHERLSVFKVSAQKAEVVLFRNHDNHPSSCACEDCLTKFVPFE